VAVPKAEVISAHLITGPGLDHGGPGRLGIKSGLHAIVIVLSRHGISSVIESFVSAGPGNSRTLESCLNAIVAGGQGSVNLCRRFTTLAGDSSFAFDILVKVQRV
jgi:hypothetical protein